jgi:Ser/Thr protein kinase RdoA (MazF antagonist)
MTQEQMLSQALHLYKFQYPSVRLIRHNENMTYQVDDRQVNGSDKTYELRIHKPVDCFSLGFIENESRNDMIRSELEIISRLNSDSDIKTQKPVRCLNGGYVGGIPDGTPVTLLEWVDGDTLQNLRLDAGHYRKIGVLAAKLHMFFLSHDMNCRRIEYDQSVLKWISMRISAAEKTGAIGIEPVSSILAVLGELEYRFGELDRTDKKLLVHADLSKSNMILTPDGEIAPIDFSLSGYSHFYMDIGELFGHITGTEERRLLLDGYKSVRKCAIEPYFIEPYFALGVLLFIACQYDRFKTEEWFTASLKRWSYEIFRPLAEREDLRLI